MARRDDALSKNTDRRVTHRNRQKTMTESAKAKEPRWENDDEVEKWTHAWIQAKGPKISDAQFEFLCSIDEAIARRDHDALTRLTDDPRLRRYAFEKLLTKTGPSRTMRGKRLILEMAAELVDEIHQAWKKKFNKWKRQNRHGMSLAIKIACEHFAIFGVSENELQTYITKERYR